MTTDSDPVLGLPGDIDADPEAIRTGADALNDLRLYITGQTEETDARFRNAAGEFTDMIAWDISTAAADELMLWEDTTQALTYGTGTLKQWAQDIEDYRSRLTSVQQRFDSAVAERKADESLDLLRDLLLEEHRGCWDTLMEQAQEAGDSLRNGPSADALERMVESGLLSGTRVSYFGDNYPGMLPEGLPSPEDHPEILHDLDGIPTVVRDKLNRDLLEDEIARLEKEVTDGEEDLDDAREGTDRPDVELDASLASDDLSELEGELDTLLTLRENFNDENADRYLLALDTENRGRAIVSNGNPDTADNVATPVPGTNNTWQSVNDQTNRADALMESASSADPSVDHAVISWIGYDAPNSAEADGPGRAEGAVDELSSFQAGLRATHENASPSHNTSSDTVTAPLW
ncbi:alpha/beta hydrolase [Nocardiopsis sp. FIRDI 009]|uniref:alpha/beta hydrolase n=1 Tax=Nocardiopsis sp. FIRDI 009 TaxID=714197 RepID=UPI0021039838|nr:alpha/beta hydrolase [Nocardiopsis sp. FIRDI 009]